MSAVTICRIAGGVLVLLVGAALGAGGFQLWRAGPGVWPDVIANETTVRRTAGGMIVMAGLLLIAGVAAIVGMSWGGSAAATAIVLVVAAAFWVNYQLFGGIRPLHTVTNMVVAAIILALLWVGYLVQSR